jgi:hypothetical protein
MHRAARMGDVAMEAGVQAPGGRVGRVVALGAVGVAGVDHPEVGGPDPAEMLLGIDQEFGPVLVHGKREMVGHAFVHVLAGGQTECGGKVGLAWAWCIGISVSKRAPVIAQSIAWFGWRKGAAPCLNLCCCATNDPRKFPSLDKAGPQWRLNSG